MAKIVVIDDEPGILRIACLALEAAGHAVVAYPDGRGGIEHIKREPPDLLITDIFMPEMEGLETIRLARGLRSEMPIIAMSGGAAYVRCIPGMMISVAKIVYATIVNVVFCEEPRE